MKYSHRLLVAIITAAITGTPSFSVLAQQPSVSFNFATSTGQLLAPNDPIASGTAAGAPAYTSNYWNNLLSDWNGNAGAIPTPVVDSANATVTGLTLGFDAPNGWTNSIATTDGSYTLMKNYLDSGTPDSPYVNITTAGSFYRKYDLVVYTDGDNNNTTQVLGPYVVRYGTPTAQAAEQTEAAANMTNLLRSPVWSKEANNYSGTFTQVNTNTSNSVATSQSGNYLVFSGLKGTIQLDATQTTGVSRAPLNGFQIVNWETTNVIPAADDPAAKVALYNGAVTLTANRTIGSLATSVGTYADFIINSGITLTLANGDLDLGNINHWVQGGGNLTSSTNTLTINRDISAGFNYAAGDAVDVAINNARMVDNGASPLNVVKTGAGKLRISTASTIIAQPYTGTTTISQGSVEIGHAQALGNTTSTIVINDTQSTRFNTGLFLKGVGLNLSRNISVANAGLGSTTLGNLENNNVTFSGNISLGKTATLSAFAGSTVTFNTGSISGAGGVIINGGGTVDLLGVNNYTGTTNVSAGTLRLNGTHTGGAAYTVGAATLAGSGSTTSAVTFGANSILSPGNSAGVLNLGAVLLDGTSTLNWELANPNLGNSLLSDRVNVTGNLTLDGILNVTSLTGFGTPVAGDTWRLFNYTGSLTNNTLTLGTLPTLTSGLAYFIDTTQTGQVNLTVATAIPEPMTWSVFAIAAGWYWRRRLKSAS
jgi:autotransporter-associated beta strand protein